jgi:hypothetical protein
MDAEPDILRRHEHSLHAGYNLKITRELLFSLTYGLIYYDYFNLENREDWYQNFGAFVTWRPRKYMELSAGYNFTLNKSNIDAFEYEAQLAGPSIVLKYQF